jgi:7,8-dihydropterin-6-yl-methyl-4-(beta-D-ribofuranosyl)aminobenzene 5'-phosphate synthase
VTILVDTCVDVLLAGSEVARRAPLAYDWTEGDQLRAEHDYALLPTVQQGERRQSVLYDAGLGRDTAIYNMDVLEIRPANLRALVLSHGHADHHAGLEALSAVLDGPACPWSCTPTPGRQWKVVFPTGTEISMPPPSRADLEAQGVQVVEERGPSLLLDDTVLVSGQTERVTEFERGFPIHQARSDSSGWEPDPWIWDDQSAIVHVRGKGLVVLSGCSDSGAVNVLRNARRVTGQAQAHAFVGGLHLTGGLFEAIIPATIAEIAAIAPKWIVPGHCTGWRATHELARALPEAYIQTSVGTTLHFAAS